MAARRTQIPPASPRTRGGWLGLWHVVLGESTPARSPMPDPSQTPFDDLNETEVLSAREIADRLRVNERTVRRAIGRGELPASRACGIRVLVADAVSWWRARRIDPTPTRERTVASRSRPVAAESVSRSGRRGRRRLAADSVAAARAASGGGR